MTLEEQGLYRNLLDACWLFAGHVIPDEPKTLMTAGGASPEEWARSGAKVLRWMQRVDCGWTNTTALEVIQGTKDISSARAAAGRKGGLVSQAKRQTKAQANEQANEQAKTNPPSPSPSPSPSPENGRTEPRISLRGEYVKAVWAALVERRGTPSPEMSTAEWDQACQWFNAGVPLAVVLRGIADCVGKPKSLMYVKPAVKDAVAYWDKAMGTP